MKYDRCYVFTDRNGPPVLVGRFVLDDERSGEFQYARSYLGLDRAFPLDPVNLPLSESPHRIASLPYVFGVLMDAGPDDWGRKVLLSIGKPANGIAPLILSSGAGVGALLFSLSPSDVKARPPSPGMQDLAAMLEASGQVESGRQLPKHLAELLEPGSDMGGARPKAVVVDEGRHWLAKFPSRADGLDQPACEYATLALARSVGIEVPEHRLTTVGGKRVLLVERFDIDRATGSRKHYLSMAGALITGQRLREEDNTGRYSYMGLSGFLVAHGANPGKDCEALFRRMAFNMLIGHVDDHSRNHGMLLEDDGYRLAPAFDMAPSNGTPESISKPLEMQALGIGKAGRERSLDNLLSSAGDFGLEQKRASDIHDEVREGIKGWKSFFERHGVSSDDVARVAHRVLRYQGAPSFVGEQLSEPSMG